jgi:hypothetical protein
MTLGLCERFHCLPDAGGLLDQDVELLRTMRIASLGGYFDRAQDDDAGPGW